MAWSTQDRQEGVDAGEDSQGPVLEGVRVRARRFAKLYFIFLRITFPGTPYALSAALVVLNH